MAWNDNRNVLVDVATVNVGTWLDPDWDGPATAA
jgi:hypothetical protein